MKGNEDGFHAQTTLKVIENREDLVEYERWLKSGRGKMMGGNDSGPRIVN